MRFLSSPAAILDNGQGSVGGLDIEETRLEMGADEPRAVPAGRHKLFEMDSVIFAIGDRVDETLGLPVRDHLFQVSRQPRFPQEGVSYEISDPQSGLPLPGLFVAGWSRKASSGLVGIARKDGVNAAQAVSQYLQSLPAAPFPGLERVRAALQILQNKPLVTQADLLKLEAVERVRARISGRADFQFDNNEDMLAAMQLTHPVNH
jgi:ferredoxin--NADP+ reductase